LYQSYTKQHQNRSDYIKSSKKENVLTSMIPKNKKCMTHEKKISVLTKKRIRNKM